MSEPVLLLQVVQASEGSALRAGLSWPIHTAVEVGRSPEADIVLADRTVSRRHLRITPAGAGASLVLELLTPSNGAFVEGRALEAGTPLTVDDPRQVELQIGGVLLTLTTLQDTEPVLEPLRARPTESDVPTPALFRVIWDAGQCRVHCGDRDLGLTGAAARMLGLLAGRAGQVVHRWDLEEALGTTHLAPLATSIRGALAKAVDAGVLTEDLLRDRLAQTGGLEGEPTSTALLRQVVRARRGHGYALHVLPADVVVEQV